MSLDYYHKQKLSEAKTDNSTLCVTQSATFRTDRVIEKWIKDTNCNCTYECAWSFNILGNMKYQKDLFMAALGKKD